MTTLAGRCGVSRPMLVTGALGRQHSMDLNVMHDPG